jgi:hypothetical protein
MEAAETCILNETEYDVWEFYYQFFITIEAYRKGLQIIGISRRFDGEGSIDVSVYSIHVISLIDGS